MSKVKEITVFYDGACPLCAREIGFYKRRDGADRVEWRDVSASATDEVGPGLSRDQALARLHVLDSEGHLVSGGAAFARLWQALPGFRVLGRLFRYPPLAWALERAYVAFLRIRPRLQALVAAPRADDEADFPRWLLGDLRSDHAGETGAVAIYHGILAVSKDPEIQGFARSHLETEKRHLELIEAVLPPKDRSRLLALWRIAGFLTGALPGVFGRRAVFATIDAVETFVDRHYAEQVTRLSREGIYPELRGLLERCRLEEVQHRDEARESLTQPPGPVTRLWCRTVAAGSAAAVALARRL